MEFDDTRRDDGERRIVRSALPMASSSLSCSPIVEPTGGVVRRLISARLSKRKERRQYAEALEAIRAQGEPDEGAR